MDKVKRRDYLITKRDEIIEEFEFSKVLIAMIAVDWTYHDGAPTIRRLKDVAIRLLNGCIDKYIHDGCMTPRHSTGGFSAFLEVYEDDDSQGFGLNLDFTLTAFDIEDNFTFSEC